MVALVLFWAAMFCILFFSLGTIVKILLSVLQGMFETIRTIGSLLILAVMGMIGFSVLYEIAYGIRTQGVAEMIFNIVIYVVVVGTVLAIICHFGAMLFGLAVSILELIYEALFLGLLKIQLVFDKAYVHFLQVIINRLERR